MDSDGSQRIAVGAIRLKKHEVGESKLYILADRLDEIIESLRQNSQIDEQRYQREYVALKLRSDIAYWHGTKEVGKPFKEWIELVVNEWTRKDPRVSPKVVRESAFDCINYLERHAGRLSNEMRESLSKLQSCMDKKRDQLPNDERLARLGVRCQKILAQVRQVLYKIDDLKIFSG